MTEDTKEDNREVSLELLLSKHNLTQAELEKVLKQAKKPEIQIGNKFKLPYTNSKVKFGVLSDTHMGHKKYRPEYLQHAIKNFNKRKVEFVALPGDICEGHSGRDGHVYELDVIGASNQLDYATEQLDKIKQPIYAITASNSHDGWFHSKGDMGLEIGKELERRLENFKFLGHDEADIELDNGLKIRMTHPGGGTAYAISYKLQKHINGINGGDKPHILVQGHYHKALYFLYRNIHAFESGTLQDQTIFMKKIGTPAMTGYWIIDCTFKENSVTSMKPEFFPFY